MTRRSAPPPAAADSSGGHHTLALHELVLLLETDIDSGLSAPEVQERQVRFGPNRLPQAEPRGPLGRLIRQVHHPLIYVLLVAAAAAFLLGETVDASVILGVVVINGAVGFVQESRAEAALDSLRAMVRTRAITRRDRRPREVVSEDLVPGDVVLLEAGDRVPADLRLVQVDELRVDETALTGESVPVSKDELVLPARTAVADRRNMVYSGTLVVHGAGVGIVVATGEETELGAIHRLVTSAKDLSTPLTRDLAHFSRVLTVVIVGLAALTFGVGLLRGEKPDEMFSAAVALAVGAIPEGLPAAMTITLAIGMTRMSARHAVVRHMPAVETLGSTTVVCSDKTGTLTRNEMTVQEVWTPAGRYTLTGSGRGPEGVVLAPDAASANLDADPALRWTLIAGASCNDARVSGGDGGWTIMGGPTEAALIVAASKAGLDTGSLAMRFPRLGTLPFSSERQYMATLHGDGPAGRRVFIKGAVERVLRLCERDGGANVAAGVLAAADRMARQGLRVLATATAAVPPGYRLDPVALPGDLWLTGLEAMLDPPRPEAVRAVGVCRDAGIEVKMITGDHATTARAVAERMGIIADGCPDDVVTGADLAALAPADIPAVVGRASVFARVSPEQKLRIVDALQIRHQVVAMTGDGVNDAPALRQADIGVAMGRGGTEVAKDAADVILTDDDFATIEAAVEEGRGVFDNLTKFIAWTLPTNVGEGLVILVAILFGATLPLMPVQILWINMTTAIALGLALAFEPKEPGIMTRPPRDPRRPILTGGLLLQTILVAVLLVGGASWLFHWEQAMGAAVATARTSALNLFVAVEALYLFSCRSLTRGVWRVGLFTNRWVIAGVACQGVAQAVITYLPAANAVFGTAPIGPGAWLRIVAISVGIAAVLAAVKVLRPSP